MSRFGRVLVALIVVLVAGAVLSAVEVPSAVPEPDRAPAVSAPPALPDRFAPWPPFVLTWEVTGELRRGGTPISGITWNPCGPVEAVPCHIRFAWSDYRRWSLTTSPDPALDPEDPAVVTSGVLHYQLRQGVVVGIRDWTGIPPLDVCGDLLLAHRREGGSVSREPPDPLGPPHWSVLAFEGEEGGFARCLGPAGIPLEFSEHGNAWRPVALDVRSPSDTETGEARVAARAPPLPPVGCDAPEGEPPFAESPAGRWLQVVADGQGSYRTRPAGRGIEVDSTLLTGGRPVLVWVSDPRRGLEAGRRREVAPGLVAEEVLRPAPVLSVGVDDLRLWASFTTPTGTSPVLLERAAHQLGRVAADLVGEAADRPYRGPVPVCRG